MIQDAFITGSRYYGTPRDNSDWDIVIRCERKDAINVFGAKDETLTGDEDYELDENAFQMTKGCVNFILCFTDERFKSWRDGTEKLTRIKPVTRVVAVAMFKSIFAAEGQVQK